MAIEYLYQVVGYGLLGDRPDAGSAGVLYATSDSDQLFRDNGTTWDELYVKTASVQPVLLATGAAAVVDDVIGALQTLGLAKQS